MWVYFCFANTNFALSLWKLLTPGFVSLINKSCSSYKKVIHTLNTSFELSSL